MKIKLTQPFAPNSAVDEFDVKQIKKALNRLGYYQPFEKVGITGIADSAVFKALKQFQQEHNLQGNGSAKPGDDTIDALNREISKTPEGQYIWRTVEDGKVRKNHAIYNRTIRNWDDEPDPGEEFNCRCWAERITTENSAVINEPSKRIQSILQNTPAIFSISHNKKASSESPWYEDESTAKMALKQNEVYIKKAAEKYEIDGDIVRAVMWAENARGGWWGLGYYADKKRKSDTIMPMNIYKDIWFSIISSKKEDLYIPEKNIEAGAILLKRIQQRIVNPTPEKIGAIWQYIGAETTNDYAAYIQRIYNEKPWLEN